MKCPQYHILQLVSHRYLRFTYQIVYNIVFFIISDYLCHLQSDNSAAMLFLYLSPILDVMHLISFCDTIWQQRSGPALPMVYACFLIAPSHYLNWCCFLISEDLRHSHENNFTANALFCMRTFKIVHLKLMPHLPGGQGFKSLCVGNEFIL